MTGKKKSPAKKKKRRRKKLLLFRRVQRRSGMQVEVEVEVEGEENQGWTRQGARHRATVAGGEPKVDTAGGEPLADSPQVRQLVVRQREAAGCAAGDGVMHAW